MKIPTYFKKENYKFVEYQENFSAFTIVSELENQSYNELFEIYYFGELVSDTVIRGIFDEETGTEKPCIIMAKCVKTGKEILLFDQAKYGYNSLFCDEFDKDFVQNCPLTKLEIPNSKIRIDIAYNIDFDEEKEDYELDENNCLESINGEVISWEEVKQNGFDYIKILATDENGKENIICELELA